MKQGLLYLLLLVTFSASAQLTDSFSDGDFTSNPAWSGDNTYYLVNGNQQLQSNGPASQTIGLSLSTPNTQFQNTQWSLWLNMDFAGTNSNQARVYLMSDQADLEGSLNGYYVSIGQDGSADAVRLYKQQGATTDVTLLISGVPGRAAKPNNNAMRIKVIRDNAGNWSLFSDTTSTGNDYLLEGTVFNNDITSTSYFGVLSRYTSGSSTNRTKFYYDDFVIQQAPLQLMSATALSATEVLVQFSADVDLGTSQNTANYNISGIGNPISAVRDNTNQNTVLLTLATPLTTGSYSLVVNNVAGQGGGAPIAANSTVGFTYTAPPTPVLYRDVVINELMADENPPVGLPANEFVELFNTTNAPIDLAGFTFSDATSTTTIPAGPNSVIAPDSFVILVANANVAAFASYGQVIGLSSMPSLNNASDVLTLKDATGNEVDKVSYTDAWYRDETKKDGGWTLEQINPFLACSGSDNWIASMDASGGTPGRRNSVFSNQPDVTAPTLLQVSVDSLTITLQFSELLDPASVAGATFTVMQGGAVVTILGATLVQPGRTMVELELADFLTPGLVYSVLVSGLTDCAGNVLAPVTVNFGIGSLPGPNELLITEIFADPTPVVSLPEQDYIELYNPTPKLLSLGGVKFSDPTATATLPNVVLLPGEYVLVVPSSAVGAFSAYGRVIGVSSFPSLNNAGDALALRQPGGAHIFSVSYTDDWYKDAEKEDGGWALEMINLTHPCGGADNWRASEDPRGGTPAQINSVNSNNSVTTPPAILRADVSAPNQVIIRFDQAIDSINAVTQAQFTVSNGITVTQVQVSEAPFTSVILTLSDSLQEGIIYTLSIANLSGCTGNLLQATVELIRPQFAAKGDLIINEVLFNPRTGGADFVELYNRSDKYIDLKNWVLANVDEGIIDNQRLITADAYVLGPKEYVVLTTNPDVVKQHYPQGREETFLKVSSMPSYNDSEGTVVLITPFEAVADSVYYNSDMHFALLDDLNGVSLERVNPDIMPYLASNWHSASTVSGYATPGYKNSQLMGGEAATATITVTPKVFTPDAGGDNDFTTIAYNLNAAGFTANITVYDSRGREIKKLVRNEQLGTEGFIKWDGTTNNQTKANVGYYVFYIELFDMTGNVQVYKEPVVVGARF